MATLEKYISPRKTSRTTTKVKLVRDAIGSFQLATESGELLQNVFVKQFERIEGSVTRLSLEVIFLTQEDKVRNW